MKKDLETILPGSRSPRKKNLTCHFCEHPSHRYGRKSTSMQITCQLSNCYRVYCSTKGCVTKLIKYFPSYKCFWNIKTAINEKKLKFICPHCIDPKICTGRQCAKKNKAKKVFLGIKNVFWEKNGNGRNLNTKADAVSKQTNNVKDQIENKTVRKKNFELIYSAVDTKMKKNTQFRSLPKNVLDSIRPPASNY
ncbi:hypothetical protein MHBO_001833 [Bonamia ostreae]|uniref:Zinc-finger domain-containing protein n=1 Tax=Bonamia ostreae TaxID=126728 RepID=A0ABV2AKB2_9EUKA